MTTSWLLMVVSAMSLLAMSGVLGYVVEPNPQRSPRQPPVPSDDLPIFFPNSDEDLHETERFDRVPHSGAKRSPSNIIDDVRYSDLYPQTAFSNAERPARDQPKFRGPQNGFGGFGGQPSPWGNGNLNNGPRQTNRPNSARRPQFPNQGDFGNGGNPGNWGNGGNQGNWGNGGNQNQPGWGNGGGGNDNSGEDAFVFDRPPPNRPTNGGGRPRPTRPTAATPTPTPRPAPGTRPTTGVPVTAPTAGSTRPNCNCPSTPEFNPVCGQDRVTYSNPGKLKCANACGNSVQMLHFGSCVTTTTPPPPSGR